MIAACCVKSAQTVNKMRALVTEGITEKDWTEALIKKSLEIPTMMHPFQQIKQLKWKQYKITSVNLNVMLALMWMIHH